MYLITITMYKNIKVSGRMLTMEKKENRKKKHIKITSRNRMKKEGEFDC